MSCSGGGGGIPVFVPTPAPGLGYGGAEYGYSPYGSAPLARQPWPVSGGYGGYPYGHHSYGSVDIEPPRVTSAASVDGYQVEVFFSEAMKIDAALCDPASYTLTPLIGAPSTVTAVTLGVQEDGGASSVIITHSGTTLGGRYVLQVAPTLRDVVGNLILVTARTTAFLSLGATPTFTVTPTSGEHVRLDFSEDMLPESAFSPGIEDTNAYGFETTYPVPIVVHNVVHPFEDDPSKVRLRIEGMTSAEYALTVAPADAIQYSGTYLPDTATTFTGVEIGTGTSTAGPTGLLLTKPAGIAYGWAFEDTSGRVLPSSTFRIDVTLDASAAVYSPPLGDFTLGGLSVSDGAVQVNLTLLRVGGVDVLEVLSGAFAVQVPVAWSTGQITLTLLRNQKAGHYAVLVDGVPLVSAVTTSFTGVPTISPGARFLLGPTYQVTQFPIRSLGFTSTQTVFSASWNFLHGVTSIFVGSTALTRPTLFTKRGPLVKNWGDPTPATKDDVEVRVNGVPVEIDNVNPYLGAITPTIPIPLTTAGSTSVDIDYVWFPNPALPMVGLNTLGLVLNKWDLHQGHHEPGEAPLPPSSVGVPDRQRFPMGLVLPPLSRQRPRLISHRYIGFERAYSALLNSPTTLLLNQSPHRIARDTLSETPDPVQVSFEGVSSPLTAEFPWALEGSDTGHVGTGGDQGYYILVDASAGTYETGTAAFYVRDEDFSFPSSGNEAVRLQITEYTLDGIFSGVAFGLHNNKHLYLVGFLEINGVKHVGLLRDPRRPDLRASWTVGPSFSITITSSTTFTTSSSVFATTALMAAGQRFQILDGPQAGVYTIADCGVEIDGDTATVTIESSSPFPEDPGRWGNNTAEAFLEVPWDEDPTTYRLVTDVDLGSAQVLVGGALSGLAISVAKVPAYPAQTTLILPTTREGAVFWGSVSRVATNTSRWAFVRYGITPDFATFHFKGIVVAAEMSDPPDADANNEWFITEDFGYGLIDSSGDTLLLKSNTNTTDGLLDTTFGYARLEPFLTTQTLTDVDARFRVESGILGAGDAQIRVQDGTREVLFSTILYREGGTPFRRLASLASISITALQNPALEGWIGTGTATAYNREQTLVIEQEPGQSKSFSKSMVPTADSANGLIIEGRVSIDASGPLTAANSVAFGARVAPSSRDVRLTFLSAPTRVRLMSLGTPIATFAFDWDDGQPHTYRIIADPTTNSVTLVIDDAVVGTAALSAFTATPAPVGGYFSQGGAVDITTVWESFSVTALPLPSLKRTIGVLRSGGNPDNIDSWEIPRTDALNVPNSDASAVVQEMDWRSTVQVRVRLDPNWGVTVFRPDLPPPPYYDGDFATEYTEPSAGWINVEYRHLPRLSAQQRFGRVAFGALDPRAITQQRWEEVRYRIYTRPDEDFIAPQHMVLNWHNVITSGELLRDTGVEVLEVESVSATLVSLKPTHIYADRVFNVTVGTTVLGPTTWSFDKDTQVITLTTPLPAEHTLVTVSFAAGKPVTNTYLCTQPLLQGVTLLNEGTPPVPKSQIGDAVREEVFGSAINDPNDTLGDIDFILNDPFRTVAFRDEAGHLYESLEFCEVDDGNDTGLIAIACDGPAPEEGWIALALEGTSFSDGPSLPGGPAIWGGSNVARDTVGGFSQASILLASGGSKVTGGNLGPGTAVLYPSFPAIPGPDRGATIRSMTMRMRLDSVFTSIGPDVEQALEDDLDIAGTVSDNVPPSSPDPEEDPNPNGTPGTFNHGAAVAEMVDYASTTYSRLGPWAGEEALAVRSQLYGNGAPTSGMGLVLMGGVAAGPGPTTSTLNIEAAS